MREYFFEPLLYTAVRVGGSLLPFIYLAIVIFADVGEYPSRPGLIGKGELIIICISLLMGALYSVLSSGYKVGYNLIFISAVLLIIGCIMGGTSLYTSELKDTYYQGINNNYLEPTNSNSNLEEIVENRTEAVQDTVHFNDKEGNSTENTQEAQETGHKRIARISIYFLWLIVIVIFASRIFENHKPNIDRLSQQSSFQQKVEANG